MRMTLSHVTNYRSERCPLFTFSCTLLDPFNEEPYTVEKPTHARGFT
jgi:hypothetical protein